MTEEPIIIEMNIAHYEALLKRELEGKQRSIVQKLLAEAKSNLAIANEERRER